MRAREFIKEGKTASIQDSVAAAMPASYAITSLPNQDPYKQYRFGVALAAARSQKDSTAQGKKEFASESPWGENMILVGYDNIDEVVDQALNLVGLTPKDKKILGTPESKESSDISNVSPVRSFKGYPR
jgi:hypothetical protein